MGSTNGIANADDGGVGIVTGGNVDFSAAIPMGVSLCSCPFATWGFFAADNRAASNQVNQIGLAQYVTGVVAAQGQIPLMAGATYTGNVIATVANGLFSGAPAIYTAVGDMSLSFGFAPGSFSMMGSITNLDSGTYSLSGTGSPASSDFNGTIGGSRPGFASLSGSHRGAFVGAGSPPAGIIGDVAIADSLTVPSYQVGGIMFGATP